jgi:hypothetical protein
MMAFHRLDVIVAHPGTPPDGNASVIVLWELVTQRSGVDQITFSIERSLSPAFEDGEYLEIAKNISGVDGLFVYEYDDITANLFSFWRKFFYRIVARSPAGTVISTARTWESNPRPHELAIIERHDFVLHYLQGAPVFGFVERTAESPPCPCFNPSLGRPSDSRCTLCLGTGRQRPFFTPIPFYADFNPDEKLVSISNLGERQPKSKDCWFSAFPMIKPGDILYEVIPAILWRVGSVHAIQPQGTTIQQVARLSAIGLNDVEYQRLPQQIPPAVLVRVVQEWERIKAERLF